MPINLLFKKAIGVYSRWLLKQKRDALSGVPEGPRVLIANHLSLVDGPFLWAHLPNDVMFTLETELSHTPPGRWVMSRFNVAAMSPRNPYGIRRVLKHLRMGGRVVVFPEGKITTSGALMRIYPGAAWLARKAGVPLQALWLAGHEGSVYTYFSERQKRQWRTPAVIHLDSSRDTSVLPASARPRDADCAVLADLLFQALRTSPINERPLSHLVPAALQRFGKTFAPYQSGDRVAPTLATWRQALTRAQDGPLPELGASGRLFHTLLRAWKEGAGVAISGDWWDAPDSFANGALQVGQRVLSSAGVRQADYWLRAQTGLRLKERVFFLCAPTLETIVLAAVSPLTIGTVSLFTSPASTPVRPARDDIYDRDAQVLIIGETLPGSFYHAPDGCLSHLHAVFISADDWPRDVAAELRRVCGREPRLLPRLPDVFLRCD